MTRDLETRSSLLSYRGASVGYGRKVVVAHADLDVRPAEVVGLIGPNGAGKSTLLRAVTGVADVSAGSVELAGTPIARLAPADRAKLVGVVPQQVGAAFAMPALDFVEMGRNPHLGRFEQPGEADRRIAARVMERTDTLRLADTPVSELSGGDLQRLALAQALAQEPRLLLLDEPTSHLDLNHRLQVLDLVRELAYDGMAVLVVFHDLDLAARYADRLSIVADGRLRAPGPPNEVLTADSLREVFGVRAVVGTDAVTGAVSVTPILRDDAVAPRGDRGRIFLVAGSGSGAALMRRLVLAGWDVVAAPLNVGDVDAGVADALGIEYPRLAPFGAVDAASSAQALALARSADCVAVTDVPFGGANLANLEIAEQSGRPVVLAGDIIGRDFAGGGAASLWQRLLAAGAIHVDTTDAIESALDSACGHRHAVSDEEQR